MNNKPKITIAIDFDGTVVEHRFPFIGKDNEHCVEILKNWCNSYDIGLILDTMRCGKELEDAVNWFRDKEIPLYGISKHPTQETWTTSPKCDAHYSIDDRNVGTPLIMDSDGYRTKVDWLKLNEMFEPILKQFKK